MRKLPIFRLLFGLAAAAAMCVSVWIAVNCRDNLPVLLAAPEAATQQVQTVMGDLCEGDFPAAREGLYGMPEIDADRKPAGAVGSMIWQAYVQSLDFELVGELYTTDQGLAQNVKIIHLELPAVTENLGQRARALLEQGVAQAESVSEIYGEDNSYKESFVAEVLEEATRQALEEDARYTYQIIPLQLVYSENQWWVMPDRTLLKVFSGSTADGEAGR